jgi:WD40 repeat protein
LPRKITHILSENQFLYEILLNSVVAVYKPSLILLAVPCPACDNSIIRCLPPAHPPISVRHEDNPMKVLRPLLCTLVIVPLAFSLLRGDDTKKDDKEPDKISYYKDIRPIFVLHCQGCHQPAKAEGGYVMTNHKSLLERTDSEEPGVVPGEPDKSVVLTMITPQGGKPPLMPRGKEPLSARDVKLIKRWIAEGAKDDSPASGPLIDAEHPPTYELPPVVTALAFSPDNNYLAVSGYHEILVYHGDGTKLEARLVGLSERVQSLAFSPDGKWLAATGGSPGRFGEVQIWDFAKKKLKMSLPVTFDTVYGVSWSPDGSKIAFGCADNSLRAIEAATGKQVLFQGGHSDWVLGTVFSKDGSHLVSVSRDRSMKLTEVATERLVDNITSITPGALKGGLLAVDRHPKKDDLLIGGADGIPKLYQMYRTKARKIGDDFNFIRAYGGLPGRIFTVKFSADGSLVMAGSSKDGTGEARIYQTEDSKLVAKIEGTRGAVYAVAFRPDGALVASAGFDGVVLLSDSKTGKLIRQFSVVPVTTAAK